MIETLQFHPTDHTSVLPRIEKHTIGIAIMNLEHARIDAITSFLTHTDRACFRIVQANMIYSVVHEQTVDLARGLVDEKLVSKELLS